MSRPLAVKGSAHVSSMFSTPGFGRFASIYDWGKIDACRRLISESWFTMRSAAGADPAEPDDEDVRGNKDDVQRQSALEALYREERTGLLRFLTRTSVYDKAEDIVHQVFLKLQTRSAAQADAIDNPAAYLHRSVRNMLYDEARITGRQALHDNIDDIDIPGSDPVTVLEARDRLARIEMAVLRLKPLTRQIFLACRIDGYSYAEIAEQTGLSVKGVEKQMSRAIRQLGRHLTDND